MGSQETEVQANYKGAQTQPGVDFSTIMKPQTTDLIDHHKNMPAPLKVNIVKVYSNLKALGVDFTELGLVLKIIGDIKNLRLVLILDE